MDTQPAARANAAYRSPECRAAVDWPEAHQLCAGNRDVTVEGVVAARLRCACSCHT